MNWNLNGNEMLNAEDMSSSLRHARSLPVSCRMRCQCLAHAGETTSCGLEEGWEDKRIER